MTHQIMHSRGRGVLRGVWGLCEAACQRLLPARVSHAADKFHDNDGPLGDDDAT